MILALCLICTISMIALLGALLFVHKRGARQGPARGREPLEIVADLDAIVSRTVGIHFQGRMHELRPLPLHGFLEVLNGIAKLEQLRAKPTVDEKELLDAYEGVFTRM